MLQEIFSFLFQQNKKSYLDAFFENINWEVVNSRY
ncbi:MAG: Fe-Mn family superoxide dismutase [Candidatus Thorarchaeota archaeon]